VVLKRSFSVCWVTLCFFTPSFLPPALIQRRPFCPSASTLPAFFVFPLPVFASSFPYLYRRHLCWIMSANVSLYPTPEGF